MNWDVIGAVGELIGATAVVLTIFYLARQISQNTHQTKLSSIQAINASNDSAFDPIYIPENSRIWTRCHAKLSDVDDHERAVFDMLMARLIGSFDTSTYQHQNGAYDDATYRRLTVFYTSFLSTPGGAEWYASRKHLFSDATQAALQNAPPLHSGRAV